MIKNILIVGLILCVLSVPTLAGTTEHTLSTGWFIYSNDVTLHVAPYENRDTQYTAFWYVQASNSLYPDENSKGAATYCEIYPHLEDSIKLTEEPAYPPDQMCDGTLFYCAYSGGISGYSVGSSYLLDVRRYFSGFYETRINIYATVIESTDYYNVTGTMDCVNYVDMYINHSGTYYKLNNEEDTSYDFPIIDGYIYKLVFSDAHEYEFTCNNSDINYDHDNCSHSQYRFEESCGNLIPDSEGVFEEIGTGYYDTGWFYTGSGIFDISNSSASTIYLYSVSFIGQTGWVIDPVITDTEYTLMNPNIAWGLKVIVQNESDDSLIDGAGVMVNQSCYCTDGYSTRNKRTVNGMVEYGDMSLQDASIHVTKDGYKFLDENSTGYNVFLSGRSNFSSKTWIVKLAPSSSNNTSEWYEVGNKVDIHFRDINGNRTSQILDSDANVYLYYENNNTEGEAMTMRFESSSTHTYFTPEQTWTIAHDTIGYKTIANSYFNPWDYSYRAVIYNSSIYGWNITIPLTVRNDTRETEGHYENLTTNLWFRYEQDGKVDFRDDMEIVSHANSNNTTLMTIDLELWKDGLLLCYKNLTASDYAGASYPYYYVWEPSYDYITGSNYSIRMYGYDRTLLETAYVDCVSDETTRKNKLTIGVKDRAGNNLDNAYIHLEGWGSLPTGNTYYNAYEGIDNGDYRYKATKSGYTGVGWNEVNISDGDKIVWYTLTSDYTNASVARQKFDDQDIKGFFFPLMYFLFICIILGGLRYVTK